MIIPLSIFLYIYLAFVAIWAIFSLIGVYHVVRFGQIGLVSFFSVIAYAGGSLVILNLSYSFLNQIDWETAVSILGGAFQIGF